MRFYSDSEIDWLIDELSKAAKEAVEKAAAEAAKAATLAAVEREGAALREAAQREEVAFRWRMEAEANMKGINEAKRKGMKNAFLAGAICLIGGFVAGTIIISR